FGAVCPYTEYDEYSFEYENAEQTVKNYMREWKSIIDKKLCVCSAGALISYLNKTQKRTLDYLSHSNLENEDDFLGIDYSARKTLELVASTTDGKPKGSLYWFMNNTSTPMGARLLRKWIEKPTTSPIEINRRFDCVEFLLNNRDFANKIREFMGKIFDLERIATRASYGNISPKDCRSLGDSLKVLAYEIYPNCINCDSEYVRALTQDFNNFAQLSDLICSAIDPAPASLARDGGVICDGFDAELDEYRAILKDSRALISQMEENEKALTGIKNLKI
ncbi:MAG: hypothetical protein IJY70_04375, partial [Clostridia bacterium]|nr:hypothetical protein [Clostridia bacterium]